MFSDDRSAAATFAGGAPSRDFSLTTEKRLAAGVDGRLDRLEQFTPADRLHQIGVKLELSRAQLIYPEIVRRQHQHHQLPSGVIAEAFHHLEAVHPRHAAIEQHQVVGISLVARAFERGERLGAAFGLAQPRAQRCQEFAQQQAIGGVIVHD